MFKKVSLFAVLAIMVFAVSPAMAQDDDGIDFDFSGKFGWHFLQSDPYTSLVDNNWIAGGDVIIWFPQGFGVGADIKFSYKETDAADIDDYDIDFEWFQMPISLNAYYKFPVNSDSVKPYVGGGLTIVYTDVTATYLAATSNEVSADDTNAGFNFIAGIEFGDMFFFEGQYIWSEATFEGIPELTNPEDDEDGVNVGGFNFTFGVRF